MDPLPGNYCLACRFESSTWLKILVQYFAGVVLQNSGENHKQEWQLQF
jgi:hypothetical protein